MFAGISRGAGSRLVQELRRARLHRVGGSGPDSGTERLHDTGGWIGIGAHRVLSRRMGNCSRSVRVRPLRSPAAVGTHPDCPDQFHDQCSAHAIVAQLIGGACFGIVVILTRRHSLHPALSRPWGHDSGAFFVRLRN